MQCVAVGAGQEVPPRLTGRREARHRRHAGYPPEADRRETERRRQGGAQDAPGRRGDGDGILRGVSFR